MKRFSIILCALVSPFFTGCASNHELYMPIEEGSVWDYTVRSNLNSQVERLKVNRRLTVFGVHGWELSGLSGTSRLAWREDVLYADELCGTRYYPPLPIFAPVGTEPVRWTGWVSAGGKRYKGAGKLKIQTDKRDLVGKKVPMIQTTAELTVGKRSYELKSWFARGIGIVHQEQRVDDAWVRQIDYISGP